MALVIGNSSAANSGAATVSSLTWAHTAPSLAHEVLWVAICYWDNAEANYVTGITYGGVALTMKRRSAYYGGGNSERTELWYLIDPPAGAANIIATLNAATSEVCGLAVDYSGVNVNAPTSTDVEAGGVFVGSPGTLTVNLASVVGEIVVDFAGVNNYNAGSTMVLAVGAGQTQIRNTASHNYAAASSYESGAASVTMSWTATGGIGGTNSRWAQIAISIKPYIDSPVRAVRYTLRLREGRLVIVGDQGEIIEPWLVEPDNWMSLEIPGIPTSIEPPDFVGIPYFVYLEEVEYDFETGVLTLRNSRGQQMDVITARASGMGTI
jgi:hypothetical protein